MIKKSRSLWAGICTAVAITTLAAGAVNLESVSDPIHEATQEDSVANALKDYFTRQDRETYPLAAKAGPGDWFCVDIKAQCNINLFPPKQGVVCPVFFSSMEAGRRSYYGVPFDIVNPASNDFKSAIGLASERLQTTTFPNQVKVNVKQPAKALYLLMTTFYAESTGEQSLQFNFADGTSQKFKLQGIKSQMTQAEKDAESEGTRNIGDWYLGRNIVYNDNTRYVFIPTAKGARTSFHAMYVVQWVNPTPDKAIESVVVTSDRAAAMAPFVVAITGKR